MVCGELESFPEIPANDRSSFLSSFLQVIGHLLYFLSLVDKLGFGWFSSSAVTSGQGKLPTRIVNVEKS